MGRVCLLTGAGGVLGDAFCRILAEHYTVIAVYRSHPPLVTSQESELFDPVAPRRAVPESAHPVFAIRADLAEPGAVERVVELSLARCEGIDLLVNAAADVVTMSATTDPGQVDRWERQLRLNTVVPVQLSAMVAERCWRRQEHDNRTRSRNVVNVSSTAGLGSAPGWGRGFYGASKAALNVLTAQMAVEYGRLGVRVNAVAPTFFPEAVSTESVVSAVSRCDRGRMTGRILVLEAERTRWI